MAIPAPSTEPSAQRQRVILRVSVLTAVTTSILATLMWAGVLPSRAGSSERSSQRRAATCPHCETCPPASASTPAPADPSVAPQIAQATAPNPTASPAAVLRATSEPLRRFTICDAPRGEPKVVTLPVMAGAPPAIGVHCGTTVHVIAFDRGEPRRIARFEVGSAGTPAAKSGEPRPWIDRAGDILATDLDGDGATDLIVGTSREDERGSPRSGVLMASLRSKTGSFEPPRLLAPMAVGALRAVELDDAAGSDIAVLRLEDARLPRPNELVLFRGGPAPIKLFAMPAGIGVDQLGSADFDLDGRVDLILSSKGRGAEIVFMGTGGHPKQRTPLTGVDVATISIADFNADGHDDALLGGHDARVILASSNAGAMQALAVPTLQDVEAVQVLDWNGDGKLDVLGVREHALVAMVQKPDLKFEPETITRWPDADFQLRAALAGRAYGGPLGLVLIASPVRARGRAELFLVSEMPEDAINTHVEDVADAPLRQQLALP